MNNEISFPLDLKFHISTFANDFTTRDSSGKVLAYVRQKLFKLKEEIQIFSDDSKNELIYKIKANKWLDFSASYMFLDKNDNQIGKITRKGWFSIWKANYQIYNQNDQNDLIIKEDNPWIKIMDSLIGEIPGINFFTGYLFNPKYNLTRTDGTLVAQLIKKTSLFGRRFVINKHSEMNIEEQNRVILGFMMMILLERKRG